MHILIVAATAPEIAPLTDFLQEESWKMIDNQIFKKKEITVEILVTGLGIFNTAIRLQPLLMKNKYTLAIQLGIGGSYDYEMELGSAWRIRQDTWGDLGAESPEGYLSVFDLGFEDPELFPYSGGWISETYSDALPCNLPVADGITVQTTAGTSNTVESRKARFGPVIESMEGAAFLYSCHLYQQKAVQIRSVSNYVTERNRDAWDIPSAVQAINQYAQKLLAGFCLKPEAF